MGRFSGIPRARRRSKCISLNAWTADFKTEYEDVTCFGDVNRVYIPGMKDAGGTLGGFFNSAELALFEAAEQDTPGLLKLLPSSTEAARSSGRGPAYMDASIDASLSAPKVSGTWKAAGPFLLKGGALTALAARGGGRGGAPDATRGRTRRSRPRDVFDSLTITGGAGAVLWGSPRRRRTHGVADRAHESRRRDWMLTATITRIDKFQARQAPLLFTAPRPQGFWAWPIEAIDDRGDESTGTLGAAGAVETGNTWGAVVCVTPDVGAVAVIGRRLSHRQKRTQRGRVSCDLVTDGAAGQAVRRGARVSRGLVARRPRRAADSLSARSNPSTNGATRCDALDVPTIVEIVAALDAHHAANRTRDPGKKRPAEPVLA